MGGIAKGCLQKGNFWENWYVCVREPNVRIKAIYLETDPNLLKRT